MNIILIFSPSSVSVDGKASGSVLDVFSNYPDRRAELQSALESWWLATLNLQATALSNQELAHAKAKQELQTQFDAALAKATAPAGEAPLTKGEIRYSRLELRSKIGDAAWRAIRRAAKDDPMVDDIFETFQLADYISTADERTVQAFAYLQVQELISADTVANIFPA
jgi:hypothetical protein